MRESTKSSLTTKIVNKLNDDECDRDPEMNMSGCMCMRMYLRLSGNSLVKGDTTRRRTCEADDYNHTRHPYHLRHHHHTSLYLHARTRCSRCWFVCLTILRHEQQNSLTLRRRNHQSHTTFAERGRVSHLCAQHRRQAGAFAAISLAIGAASIRTTSTRISVFVIRFAINY